MYKRVNPSKCQKSFLKLSVRKNVQQSKFVTMQQCQNRIRFIHNLNTLRGFRVPSDKIIVVFIKVAVQEVQRYHIKPDDHVML